MKPEDSGRRFIISYRLADDMITIYEPPVRNSGIIGGKFLERTRIAKPGSSPDKPVFYGPDDMHIGSVIHIFNHRFVITNADEYVLKYMEDHPQQFSGKILLCSIEVHINVFTIIIMPTNNGSFKQQLLLTYVQMLNQWYLGSFILL